ncbi:unnamed protein product [Lactuca virosa]|uniref:Uncharacterized protein n=1 Tax=Lactuca virosa TaxID=75947 RepID=A0AAU9PLE3_9ASTR|nr:unnamed protein product [Lactuca virosa]
MGTDRKLKKKRSPAEFSSEDEGKNKRRRSSETKSDKKERDSHRKHKSHKSSSTKEGKHKHKSKHHKHERRVISNFKELSDADYFSKNNEFATWLKDEKDMFFSDLSSESARPRTSHNWKIKVDTKGHDVCGSSCLRRKEVNIIKC